MPTASEIDTALLRPLPEPLVFDGVPLGDVLKQLGRVGEVRLSIDEPALHKQGVDLDAAITARPGGVPLGDALSEIVRTKQLRWLPDDGPPARRDTQILGATGYPGVDSPQPQRCTFRPPRDALFNRRSHTVGDAGVQVDMVVERRAEAM
jgi:hypothetical protein